MAPTCDPRYLSLQLLNHTARSFWKVIYDIYKLLRGEEPWEKFPSFCVKCPFRFFYYWWISILLAWQHIQLETWKMKLNDQWWIFTEQRPWGCSTDLLCVLSAVWILSLIFELERSPVTNAWCLSWYKAEHLTHKAHIIVFICIISQGDRTHMRRRTKLSLVR